MLHTDNLETDSSEPPAHGQPLSDFTRATVYERARLAASDPEGERDAVAPLSQVTARQTMLAFHDRPAAPERPQGHDRDVELLIRLGADLTRTSGRLRCPAHGSTGKTLSWRKGDRRYLIHCFAGCSFEEIEAAS